MRRLISALIFGVLTSPNLLGAQTPKLDSALKKSPCGVLLASPFCFPQPTVAQQSGCGTLCAQPVALAPMKHDTVFIPTPQQGVTQDTTKKKKVVSDQRIRISKEVARIDTIRLVRYDTVRINHYFTHVDTVQTVRVDTLWRTRVDTITVTREVRGGTSCWKSFSICTIVPLLAAGVVGYYVWKNNRDHDEVCNSNAIAIAGPTGTSAYAGCGQQAVARANHFGLSLAIW